MREHSLGLAVLISLLPGIAAANEPIRLLNWEDYLGENVIEQWDSSSGHTLEQVYFDSDEKRDAILINSSRHQIDLAIIDEVTAKRFGREQGLIELNESNVPNSKHIAPFWRERCGHYALPYFWGTLGIAYRTDKVKNPPRSWRDILEPNEALKGHIGMLNDITDMLAPALFLADRSINTENSQALKEVFTVLKAQTKDVLTYDYAITYLQASPKAAQLHMAMAYSGDQFTLNEITGEEGLWEYSVPEEGTILWVDCMAISAKSDHQQEALEFINYLNEPKIAAQNAEEIYFATPNLSALKYMSNDTLNDKGVYPDQHIIDRSQLYEEMNNETIQLRQRITNAVINIYESQ